MRAWEEAAVRGERGGEGGCRNSGCVTVSVVCVCVRRSW